MLNIGIRPTFYEHSDKLAIEVHIFNFNKYIYGQTLELFFVKKIRKERKFALAQLLKKQLQRDSLRTKTILKAYTSM